MFKLFFVYGVIQHFSISLALKDLSEIQYRFTPCGANGTTGPTLSECIDWYKGRNSSIVNGNKLFEFANQTFEGAQGFRVPKSGVYNVTVAGASGGRGLCSYQHGRGVLWEGTIYLQNTQNLLVLVGQKGLGPCDISDLPQCKEPPEDITGSVRCFADWHNWLVAQADLSLTDKQGIFNFAGGGAGGGASMIRVQERHTGSFQTWPLVVAGGGGGTSSNMSFAFLDQLNIALPPGTENGISLQERFTLFVDAKSTDRDYSISKDHNFTATRGYVSFLADIYRKRPGAGGGYLPAASLYQDGAALNQSSKFALGGYDCLRYSASLNRHTLIETAHGGFGGGGGQCQSGGSGGGFSGGSIFSGAFGVAGNGGFSANISSGANIVQVTKFGLNEEQDGFIEIVHANCECSYKCDIMYEAKKFRCTCPDDYSLTPNEFDCFQELEYNVSSTDFITEDQYIIKIIDLEVNVEIFSLYAATELSSSTDGFLFSNIAGVDIERHFCVLVFLDSKGDVVLLSNIVRSSPSIFNKLSHGLTDKNTYSFLDTAIEANTAVIISNFYCRIMNNMQLNISYISSDQGNSSSSELTNVTEIIAVAKAIENVIFPGEDKSVIISEDVYIFDNNKIIKISISLSALIVATVLIVTLAMVIFIFVHQKQTRNKHGRTQSWIKRQNEYTSMNIEGSLISNKLYMKHSIQKREDDRSTSYCFIDSQDIFDDGQSNGKMKASSVWEYSRKHLVYMKELGEGNFGKVLLMKAIGMPHINRDVLVAVKTLSSNDPDIVKKFTKEANLMKKLSHPNIISILAVIFDDVDEDNAPLMVLEYMPYGDLQSFLRKHRPGILFEEEEIHYRHFINFARDISHAIKFLSEKRYIHRDIACRNCLVDASLNVKLGDFGLTVKSNENGLYKGESNAVLPIKWISPESLLYGIFSTSSDVWSFGVLLWEMATYGELPLSNVSNKDIYAMAENRALHHPRPSDCPDYYYDIITKCHLYNHQDRITIDELFLLLTEKLGQDTETGKCFVIINH